MRVNSVILHNRFYVMLIYGLSILWLPLFPGHLSSALAEDSTQERKNRIEVSGSYEYLSPNNSFGNWGTLSAAFYRKEQESFTWFMQAQAFTRNDGNGLLASAGAYKDWTAWLYTYTAIAAGTNVDYLPQMRIDHDFNIKFGPDKKFIWVFGGTYIGYFDVHRDYILSTGLITYWEDWVAEYRIFRNLSAPGWVESYSHLISLAYGQEGRRRTTATCSFGKQAYLATALATPEAVKKNSFLVALNHREWLAANYGVFGELSYFDLQSTYKKGGILFGVFYEF
jgi:YaiO family outer membrane protein